MSSAPPEPAATPYDDVAYTSFPYPQSHPDHLASVAALFGMRPAPIDACRVLELGCASGGNLIPIAGNFPGSRFLGVDLSHRQIADGAALVAVLELANIELRQANVLDIGSRDGKFDYIIAHGLFSWVARDVQEKVLDICRENLAPQGVVYVSYNTYPGWRMRGQLRDMMMYRVRGVQRAEDRARQSRELLEFLAEAVPARDNPYGILLQNELKALRERDDFYLLHEHLEDVNEPFYFHEFIDRAGAHGLQYLGEAEFRFMWARNFPPPIEAGLLRIASNQMELEQYMDFVRNRTFRQTLLCHADVALDRNRAPQSVQNLHLASSARPENPPIDVHAAETARFVGPNAVMTTDDPLVKAAMLHLAEAWPRFVPFQELLTAARARLDSQPLTALSTASPDDVRRLAEPMLQGFSAAQIELSTTACLYTLDVSERPRVSALARIQAERGGKVTNLRHEMVPLNDLQRRIVRCLDGQRRREDIVEHLVRLVSRGRLLIHVENRPVHDEARVRDLVTQELETQLPLLARQALLVS